MIDTTAYRFRTSVGGFHKGDVADYITKASAAHRAETSELKDRIQALEQENETLRQQLLAVPTEEQEQEPVSTTTSEDVSDLELQAYRRAEATERMANQRAKKLYQSLEAICKDTQQEFSRADTAMAQMVNTVMEQAQALEESYKALSAVLSQSRAQLSSMDAMIPDPAEELEAEAWLS